MLENEEEWVVYHSNLTATPSITCCTKKEWDRWELRVQEAYGRRDRGRGYQGRPMFEALADGLTREQAMLMIKLAKGDEDG